MSDRRRDPTVAGRARGIGAPRLLLLGLIGIVLGTSGVLAWTLAQVVASFGSGVHPATGSVVRNDFVAMRAIAEFAARGRPELAYDLDALHALEKQLDGNDDMPLMPAAYPPTYALVLMPLAWLDMVDGYRLWAAGLLALVVAVAVRVASHWQMLALAPLFPPVVFCAAAGQNGNLTAALVGVGLMLLPVRPALAGIAFGMMTFKPQVALAIPFALLAGGHYRALALAGATAIAMVLASIVAFGHAPWLAFVPNIGAQAQIFFDGPLTIWHRIPTMMIAVRQLGGDRQLAMIAYGLAALAALAALIYVWRMSTRPWIRALALAAAMPLATPYFFDYDLAVLIVPFAYLLRQALRSGLDRQQLVVTGLVWLAQPVLTFMPEGLRWPIGPLLWMALLGYACRFAARDRASAAQPA